MTDAPPGLIVDASVWVSAADTTDSFSGRSRAFLAAVAEGGIPVSIPDFCTLEVACALARRLDDGAAALALADQLLTAGWITVLALEPALVRRAIELGTERRLRAGDAIYVAVAERAPGRLVAWDRELIGRAGAISPDEWLEQNGSGPWVEPRPRER